MEGRIRQIESFLEDVEIVPPSPEGVVGLGTIVAIVYEGDSEDAAEHYLIGHVEEKPDEDHISVMSPSSPLGSALLGATVGATVSYDAPNGKLKVTVLLTRTQGKWRYHQDAASTFPVVVKHLFVKLQGRQMPQR